jgi:membrane protein YqaA with SNARE-associated domain
MMVTKWEYYALMGKYGPDDKKKAEDLCAKRRGMFLLFTAAFSVIMVLFCLVFGAMLIAKM